MEDHYGLFSGTQLARSREVLTKFKAPTYTSADRDLIVSPEEGMMIYQSTDDQFEVYENDTWTVISSAAAGAEANTASNTGSAGTGVFKQKTGVDLELYKLNSANSLLTIALDGTDKIDFTLNEGSLDHTGILNIGTNTHAQLDTHKTIAESHMSGGLDKHASTTSAELATVISDETGTGLVVFNDSPQLLQPDLRLETTGASGFIETGQIGWVAGPKYMTIGDGTTTRNFYDKTVYDAAYQATLAEGAFVDGDKTKLDGIEASADVTDTANVTSAGALMDSELASIADVKALNQSVVSGATPTFTNTNFTEATDKNYVTDAEKTVIGNTSGTNSGDNAANTTYANDYRAANFVADTDYQSVPLEGAFADGDKTKLDGIETGADVTDETNVKSALDGATITNATVGATDKILFQDADDSDNLKQDDAQTLANLAQPEGTAIKSTGEAGGSKFLREDGDGTSSWQSVPGGVSIGDVYPVGSIYIEVTGTNPGTTFGVGTWVAFGTGRMLVGLDSGDTDFDTVEETGGAKTATIAQANLPNISTGAGTAHTHTQNSHRHTDLFISAAELTWTTRIATGGSSSFTGGSSSNIHTGYTTATNQNESAHTHSLGGSGTALDIVNPYIVVYMWKRTA